jgi:hypothetical protein
MQDTNEDQALEDVIVAIGSAQYEVESAQESLNEAKRELSNAIQLLAQWVERRETERHVNPNPTLRAEAVASLPNTNVVAILETPRSNRVLLEEARARARVWAEQDRKARAKKAAQK